MLYYYIYINFHLFLTDWIEVIEVLFLNYNKKINKIDLELQNINVLPYV